MKEYLNTLYTYNFWANKLIINWLEPVSETDWDKPIGGSFGSLSNTVLHLVAAEKIWDERIHEDVQPFLSQNFNGTKTELMQLWSTISGKLLDTVKNLAAEVIDKNLDYNNVKGEPFTFKYWEVLTHVANHSTYHRGQIVADLRTLGYNAGSTDLISYYRGKDI